MRIISAMMILLIIIALAGCDMEPYCIDATDFPQFTVNIQGEENMRLINVSERINLNQLGEKPLDKKKFVVQGEVKEFEIYDFNTNELVFEGYFSEAIDDECSGEIVSTGEFTALSKPGTYIIVVPDVGRSYEFRIADDVYNEFSIAVLKMLYFQRCSVDLKEDYAGVYTHSACHNYYGKFYRADGTQFDGSGGWHDAGDYGKYSVPAARTIADLLFAYQLFYDNFSDATGIPESGNGIPDILDEARIGLEWLLKMQDAESGGVYHKFTPEGFPTMNIMPQNDFSDYYAFSISPTATGSFCAIMAFASRIYLDYDAAFSESCLNASKLAYAWIIENPDAQPFENPDGVISGDYRDLSHRDEYYWAAMELYLSTGNQIYLDDAKGLYDNHTALFWSDTLEWYDVGFLGTFSFLLSNKKDADPEFYKVLEDSIKSTADELVKLAGQTGYNIAMAPKDYVWGSNMIVSNRAVLLIIADRILPNSQYINIAKSHLDYLLGCNALSQCYITGFGSKSIKYPHHRPSLADGIKEPIPGMVSGGPNAHLQDSVASTLTGMPPSKCFVDDTAAYSLNEVTTYWNSPVVFLCAYFCRK